MTSCGLGAQTACQVDAAGCQRGKMYDYLESVRDGSKRYSVSDYSREVEVQMRKWTVWALRLGIVQVLRRRGCLMLS